MRAQDNHQARGRLSLITCRSGESFASQVERHLLQIIGRENEDVGSVLRRSQEVRFANGEIKIVLEENIRGDDVYVIQCHDDPLRRDSLDPVERRSVNDNLMALLAAVNAAYQSDAESITAVIPQYPYSRQERKKAREPITARLVANALEDAGANRVITLDIHAEAIQGFFHRATLEDLHASKVIIDFFRQSITMENACIVAPDTGGADKARYYAKTLNCGLAVVDKARDYTRASVVESMRLVGDVRDKRVILPDDLVATGGTLINACRLLREEGAREVYVACSLPFFNGKATEKLDAAHREGLFQLLVGTDAVWHGPAFAEAHPWYREVSVAEMFARVIYNINRKYSVSELLR